MKAKYIKGKGNRFVLNKIYELNEQDCLIDECGFSWERGLCRSSFDWLNQNTSHRFKIIKENTMEENYIVLGGKKAKLTDEQLEALGIKKRNPFERVKEEEEYNIIDDGGVVRTSFESDDIYDEKRFDVANYCTDEKLFQQRAYQETLSRLLYRFAMENGGIKSEEEEDSGYWEIYGNEIDFDTLPMLGAATFASKEAAKRAMEEIVKPFCADHPDFKRR